MIRVLFMIAIAGFILSVGTFAAAVAIGGPDAITRGGWNLAAKRWTADWSWDDHEPHHPSGGGPTTTRTLAWSGADSLEIDLPADLRYIQQAGPGTVEITGPERLVADVAIHRENISYDSRRHRRTSPLTIVVRAPNISTFDVSGRNTLRIEGYRQPKLRLDMSGDGEVHASGVTDEVALEMSGSGDADLGELKTQGAAVDISGSADAAIAPSVWARLDISGQGDVRLLTRPDRLETDISGSGKVRQLGPPGPPAPEPPPPPKTKT